MLQKKRAQLIRLNRRKNITEALGRCREKQLLKLQLKQKLFQYKKCALVTGEEDMLNHTQYLHCQSFTFYCHEELYQIIFQLTVEQAKPFLQTFSFPDLLLSIQETIQDKTLELDQQMTDIHFNSRNQVLSSIAQLVALLTEDADLIDKIGESAPQILVKQLVRVTVPGRSYSIHEYNLVIGLINLMLLESLKDTVYQELRDINFQFFMEKFLGSLMNRQQKIEDGGISLNILLLLRYYLEYQQLNTIKVPNQVFQRVLQTFIHKTIDENVQLDLSNGKNVTDNKLLDELLQLLMLIKPCPSTLLSIIRNVHLFKKSTYIQMLTHSSYYSEYAILEKLQDEEIIQLLECAKQIEGSADFTNYLENLAASLTNMLETTKNPQSQTLRLWNLIGRTKTGHLFDEEVYPTEGVGILAKYMDFYRPEDL